MAFNIALKTVLLQKRMKQIALAHKTGIHETRLSQIVNGWIEPNDGEKAEIAKVLRTPVDQLFESSKEATQ